MKRIAPIILLLLAFACVGCGEGMSRAVVDKRKDYGPPTPDPNPYAIWRSGYEARRRSRPVAAQKPDDYRELQEAFDRIDVNNRDILKHLAEIKRIIRETE